MGNMTATDIATKITLRVLFILFSVFLIIKLWKFIFLAFGSWIIVVALDPLVTKLEEKKFPRALSATVIFFLTILLLVGLLSLLIPSFIAQAQSLAQNLPGYTEKALESFTFIRQNRIDERIHPLLEQLAQNLSQMLVQTPGDIVRIGQGIVSSLFAAITFFIATLYFLIEYPRISQSFIHIFPDKKRPEVEQLLTIIHMRIGGWLRGQGILILVIGVMTWVGLALLNIPFAVPLSIIAGLLEAIPTIGPILAMIPAAIIALAISPWKALSTIILYLLIQQIENNLVVPQVMEHTSGLDPLAVIIVLTLGGYFFGITGILLAIPITIAAWTVIEDKIMNARD